MKVQVIMNKFILSLILSFSFLANASAFVKTFNFTDADSGYVQLDGLSYGIGTGWANCQILRDSLPIKTDKRAVFRFATYVMPNKITITLVEFFNRLSLGQPTPPALTATSHLGAWMGATLDASANDFNATGATDLSLDPLVFVDGSWNNLADGGEDPTTLIVLTDATNSGNTDLMFKDTDATEDNGRAWNTSKSKCQLRVTGYYPQLI